METTWNIVGTEGEFVIVDYTRGDATIRLRVLPREGRTIERVIQSNMPSDAQFGVPSTVSMDDLIGRSGIVTTTPAVPQKASAGSFMTALVRLNRYDSLKAIIDSVPDPQGKELRMLWLRAIEFNRMDPRLITVARMDNMTDEQIDEVFTLAETISKNPNA